MRNYQLQLILMNDLELFHESSFCPMNYINFPATLNAFCVIDYTTTKTWAFILARHSR